MRIGFLFNHDQIHQVSHSLPIAMALAESAADTQILITTTSVRIATEIIRQIGPDPSTSITLVGLELKSKSSILVAGLLGKLLPATKLLIYRDNLDFFRSLDALIVTERTSLILKTSYGLETPILILSDHGAGDRAIGFGPSTARFDHILAAGRKISDRLIGEAGVRPERLTITGYPKFDTCSTRPRSSPFGSDPKPVVLYNPHVSPHLSSWYSQGRAVLDFFLDSPHYNLIFAPHIMMFQRRAVVTIDKLRLGLPGGLHPKYASNPNIHVDLGSPALTDMTYTNMADIYLGDVSSQVYEFLRNPRPCVFLNVHGVKHRADPNYAHWQSGPVIASAADLGSALEKARAEHDTSYRAIQQSLFDYTFDLTDTPSSVRAARTILQLLGLGAASSTAPGLALDA